MGTDKLGMPGDASTDPPRTIVIARDWNDLNMNRGKRYPERLWRKAILDYLFAHWSGKNPAIRFGGLALHESDDQYMAFGEAFDPDPLWDRDRDLEWKDVNSFDPAVVQVSLATFAKNDKLGILRLKLGGHQEVALYKTSTRSQYRIYASNSVPKAAPWLA